MRGRYGFVVTACLFTILGVRAAAAEDVRQIIEANNTGFVTDLLRGDAKAVAERYTADAAVMPPNAKSAVGTTAIEAFWTKEIEAGIEDVELHTTQVESSGDLAYEDGTVAITAADGKTTQQRYLVVWKHVGGEWKMHRDIWN
jgi:ketosteroid isomerase-like protein